MRLAALSLFALAVASAPAFAHDPNAPDFLGPRTPEQEAAFQQTLNANQDGVDSVLRDANAPRELRDLGNRADQIADDRDRQQVLDSFTPHTADSSQQSWWDSIFGPPDPPRVSGGGEAMALPNGFAFATQVAESADGSGAFGLFGLASVRAGGRESSASGPGYESFGAQGMAGGDWTSDAFRLGAGFAYGRTSSSTNGNLGESDSDTYTLFGFANWTGIDRLTLSGSLSYSWADYETLRRIALIGAQAVGDTEGDSWSAAIAASYDYHLGDVTYGPEARLIYVDGQIDGYTETGGGAANLIIGDQNFEVTQARLGGHATWEMRDFTPRVAIGLEQEWSDSSQVATAFASAPALGFATTVSHEDDLAGYASVGIAAKVGEKTEVNLEWDARLLDSEDKRHLFSIRLRHPL